MDISTQKIIESAYKYAGILGENTELTPGEYNDALTALQMLIDSWNVEDGMIWSINRHIFPLISGQQTYTLGVDGDFNLPRPAKIERASILVPNNLEIPIEANNDVIAWQSIVLKNVPSAWPVFMYNDYDYPSMHFNFWPIPSGVDVSVVLYVWETINAPLTLDTVLSFPPAYNDALIFNLTLRLYQIFSKQPTAWIIQQAALSKKKIHTINNSIPNVVPDPSFNRHPSNTEAWKSAGRVLF